MFSEKSHCDSVPIVLACGSVYAENRQSQCHEVDGAVMVNRGKGSGVPVWGRRFEVCVGETSPEDALVAFQRLC